MSEGYVQEYGDVTEKTAEQRIGVVSIAPTMEQPVTKPFDWFYAAIGKNTGNYMFTVAMYRQLAGDVRHVGFSGNPDEINRDYDAIVVPCANWLSGEANWDFLTSWLEQLEIPVVAIGLGLQAPSLDPNSISVSESAIRLARLFSQKSQYISVRGDFTRDYLRSIGIENVVTTGCPSIYMRLLDTPKYTPDGGLAIQSTRYWITPQFLNTPGLNRDLFRITGQGGADMVFQSEPEELEYLTQARLEALTPEGNPETLRQLYGFDSTEKLAAFLDANGHAFTDLNAWSAYVQTKAAVVGTRLHGTIVALNNGVPATLFGHDSRTSEMIAFAGLPTARFSGDSSELNVDALMGMVDDDACARYAETRQTHSHTYREFLRANGLKYLDAALF